MSEVFTRLSSKEVANELCYDVARLPSTESVSNISLTRNDDNTHLIRRKVIPTASPSPKYTLLPTHSLTTSKQLYPHELLLTTKSSCPKTTP